MLGGIAKSNCFYIQMHYKSHILWSCTIVKIKYMEHYDPSLACLQSALLFIANFNNAGQPSVLSQRMYALSPLAQRAFCSSGRSVPLLFLWLVISLMILSKVGTPSYSFDSNLFISFLALVGSCTDFGYLLNYILSVFLIRR